VLRPNQTSFFVLKQKTEAKKFKATPVFTQKTTILLPKSLKLDLRSSALKQKVI
jgi:hypothetical protein